MLPGFWDVAWVLGCRLVPGMLTSTQHVTWFPECYLILGMLTGTQNVIWFLRCYMVPRMLPGSWDVSWYSEYYLDPGTLSGTWDGAWYYLKGAAYGGQVCTDKTPGFSSVRGEGWMINVCCGAWGAGRPRRDQWGRAVWAELEQNLGSREVPATVTSH